MDSQAIVPGISAAVVVVPIAVALSVRHPWLSLTLFWILPVIKLWLLQYVSDVPLFDPTALTAGLVLLAIVATRLTPHRRRPTTDWHLISLHLAFGALMAVTYLWTTAPEYGLYKVLRFACFSTVALIGPMVLIRSPTDVRRMHRALIAVGGIIAVLMLFSPAYSTAAPWDIRQTALGANPLNPAFTMAVATVLAVVEIRQASRMLRTAYVGLIPLLMIAIYRTGSRAMFAQVLLGLTIWGLATRTTIRWVYRLAIAVVLVTAPALVQMLSEGSRTERILLFVNNPLESVERMDRLPLWKFVLSNCDAQPILGNGVGAFAVDAKGRDARDYPHNLFLEALYEEGALGLVILTAFVALPFCRYVRWRRSTDRSRALDAHQDTCFAVALSAGLVALFHWDLADMRLVWFTFGMLAAQCNTRQRKRDSRKAKGGARAAALNAAAGGIRRQVPAIAYSKA
jgi:O-antigen ligase